MPAGIGPRFTGFSVACSPTFAPSVDLVPTTETPTPLSPDAPDFLGRALGSVAPETPPLGSAATFDPTGETLSPLAFCLVFLTLTSGFPFSGSPTMAAVTAGGFLTGTTNCSSFAVLGANSVGARSVLIPATLFSTASFSLRESLVRGIPAAVRAFCMAFSVFTILLVVDAANTLSTTVLRRSSPCLNGASCAAFTCGAAVRSAKSVSCASALVRRIAALSSCAMRSNRSVCCRFSWSNLPANCLCGNKRGRCPAFVGPSRGRVLTSLRTSCSSPSSFKVN